MGEISHLAQLFRSFNKELIEYKARPLVGPGENYGSVMLSIEAKVREASDEREEDLSLVVKLCPPNPWLQQMFDTANTFRKEAWFYSTVLPLLRNFQSINGYIHTMDFFPTYVASRLNLSNLNDAVDDDAALILLNAKTLGYQLEDRMCGFDYETTKLLLENMAVFHAVSLAFKIKHPKLFTDKIRRHLNGHPAFSAIPDELVEQMLNQAVGLIQRNDKCSKYADRFRVAYEKSARTFIGKTMAAGEPFGTITHNDFWVNNTMVRWKKQVPVHNVMLDWQMIDYGNPCNDLVFFLLTSVRDEVLHRFDELVRFYYSHFIDTLQRFRCDVTPYSYDAFTRCLNEAAIESQVFHVIVMFKPILKRKSEHMEMSNLTTDVFLTMDGLDSVYMEKLWSTVQFFASRNWI